MSHGLWGSDWAHWGSDFAPASAILGPAEAARAVRAAEAALPPEGESAGAEESRPSWQRLQELEKAVRTHLVLVELEGLATLTPLQELALARLVVSTRGRLRELVGMEEGPCGTR